MDELTLRLATPIEELVPQMIAFNNAELLSAVRSQLEVYKFTDYSESVKTAKEDKAKLNALLKAINGERIRIGKIYNTPYDKFKAQIDEVLAEIKSVIEQIDEVVKADEAKYKAEKRQEIIAYFNSIVGEYGEFIKLEEIECERWYNKGTSMKSIQAECNKFVKDFEFGMQSIDKLDTPFKEQLKAFFIQTKDIAKAIEHNAELMAVMQQAISVSTRGEQVTIEEVVKEEQETAHTPNITPTRVSQGELMTITFKVEGTLEQMKALKAFLKDNGIKYSRG